MKINIKRERKTTYLQGFNFVILFSEVGLCVVLLGALDT